MRILINKNHETKASIDAISEEELMDINKLSRKTLCANEIYAFNVTLCDNEIDRDFEKFSIPALKELARLYVGKTGIFDHSMRGRDQTARIYSTEVISSNDKSTADGEPYTYLMAKAYMARTKKNADLIAEIDAGIKKEVSVGCAMGRITCSICNADLRNGICKHRRGKNFNGKLCHIILSEPTDAYEWSFVAVPAQVGAGVTKTFSLAGGERDLEKIISTIKSATSEVKLTNDEANRLANHLDFLEKQSEQASILRKNLEGEVLALTEIVMPEFNSLSFNTVLKKLTIEELEKFKADLNLAANSKIVPIPQLAVNQKSKMDNNSAFKI